MSPLQLNHTLFSLDTGGCCITIYNIAERPQALPKWPSWLSAKGSTSSWWQEQERIVGNWDKPRTNFATGDLGASLYRNESFINNDCVRWPFLLLWHLRTWNIQCPLCFSPLCDQATGLKLSEGGRLCFAHGCREFYSWPFVFPPTPEPQWCRPLGQLPWTCGGSKWKGVPSPPDRQKTETREGVNWAEEMASKVTPSVTYFIQWGLIS